MDQAKDKLNRGYLYSVTGEKYLNLAIKSAQSLRNYQREYPICLVTDSVRDKKEIHLTFDEVIILEKDAEADNYKLNKLFKLKGILSSPYEQTFFVDADTFFLDSCNELFNLLDYGNLIMVKDPVDGSNPMINNKFIPITPYNTGMIVFRKSLSIELLDNWYEIRKKDLFREEKYWGDQPAFMESLLRIMANKDPKVLIVDLKYNFPFLQFNSVLGGHVKLLHGVHDDIKFLGDIINSKMIHRGWNPVKRRIETWDDGKDSIIIRLLKSVYRKFLPHWLKVLFRRIKYR